MITFVDTNVLLDVFLPDPQWGEKSSHALDQAYTDGSLVVNEIIYAELAPQFPEKKLLDQILKTLGIRVVILDLESAYAAGTKWKKHLEAGGKRDRVLADFLIGAHAEKIAEKLLTRDRGFYKKYFTTLNIYY